jgi:pyruvate/2-oxoglutarate dehydrogenase complex dihydrolipoamide dehydrogenase (E3) component
VHLSDGTTAEGAELLLAVGRRGADLRALGAEEAGASIGDRGVPAVDEQFRAADGLFVAGDAAGGLQFTHVADYEGLVTARAAMGGTKPGDLRSVPKSTFTDPELGAVGVTVEEAQAAGIDAVEFSRTSPRAAKGRPSRGHVAT